MKKIAVVICFISVGFGVQAQIDTIRTKVPYLHYNYYDSTWCQSQVNQGEGFLIYTVSGVINRCGERYVIGNQNLGRGAEMCRYYDESQEVAILMNMDSAAEIKGLVFGINTFCGILSASGEEAHRFMITPEPYYYTNDYIFNIYDDGMNLIWSDTMATADINVDYYMEAGFNYVFWEDARRNYYATGNGGYEALNYICLCKVNFDTIIQVPQQFYIGITSSTPINTLHDTMCVITVLYEAYMYSAGNDSIYSLPYESRRYRVSNNVGEQIQNWAEEECHYGVQTCLYPILSLPCHDVEGLQYEPLGSAGTIAYVSWNGDPSHSSYELSYGPRGTAPGEGTVVQPSATHWVISPLDRNTHYDVYVRARCDLDTIKWSAWSDPLHVHIASYGINEAAAPEVTLSPNPTAGTLTVGCEAEIKEVEMYDMQGRMISGKCKEESGKCVVLDLAGLPAGSYILVAHTTKGVATRTVEKR